MAHSSLICHNELKGDDLYRGNYSQYTCTLTKCYAKSKHVFLFYNTVLYVYKQTREITTTNAIAG